MAKQLSLFRLVYWKMKMLGCRLMFWQLRRMFCMNINNKNTEIQNTSATPSQEQYSVFNSIIEGVQIKYFLCSSRKGLQLLLNAKRKEMGVINLSIHEKDPICTYQKKGLKQNNFLLTNHKSR